MKLVDPLIEGAIIAELNATDKKGVLEELTAPIAEASGIDHEELVRVLLERERLGSTGIGGGIGIPHAKLQVLESLLMGFGRSRKGVDFEAMDGKAVHLFFVLFAPEDSAAAHLKMLSKISRLLKDGSFGQRLMNAADGHELHRILAEEDEEL